MRTKLVIYWEPDELGIPNDALKDVYDEIEHCFRVRVYKTEAEALDAYANTRCTWSKLLEDNADEMSFMLEACEHIHNHDYEWLEEHFV